MQSLSLSLFFSLTQECTARSAACVAHGNVLLLGVHSTRTKEKDRMAFWMSSQSLPLPPGSLFWIYTHSRARGQGAQEGAKNENTFNVITFIKLNVSSTCRSRARARPTAIGIEALWGRGGVVGPAPKPACAPLLPRPRATPLSRI